jgi:hypothetical protein
MSAVCQSALHWSRFWEVRITGKMKNKNRFNYEKIGIPFLHSLQFTAGNYIQWKTFVCDMQ